MPARYDFSQGQYRLTCTSCTRVHFVDSPDNRDEITDDGTPVSDIFAWHSGHSRWYTRCRECDRRVRRERNANRVPGTTARRSNNRALGIDRPFGVEFECAVPSGVDNQTIVEALRAEGLTAVAYGGGRTNDDWYVKGDPSISVPGMYGREVVSPVLRGEDGEEQIRKATRALRRLGARVNRSCGTHVHHDANDLTVDAIKRVARSWFNNQTLISGLVSASRRAGGSFYCAPLTDSDVYRIDLVSDLRSMRHVHVDRYRALNLTAYGKFGTLEVRQHQGTLDAAKVISWVRLGQAIIDTAKTGDAPVARYDRLRDLFAGLGDNLGETARTYLLGRGVTFNAVTV
jgi:Putative amidoligase enzyme